MATFLIALVAIVLVMVAFVAIRWRKCSSERRRQDEEALLDDMHRHGPIQDR